MTVPEIVCVTGFGYAIDLINYVVYFEVLELHSNAGVLFSPWTTKKRSI